MNYRTYFLIFIAMSICYIANACSCPPKGTVKKGFDNSALVVKAEVIATDTISISEINSSGRGLGFWKSRFSEHSSNMVRVKMLVHTRYKSTLNLPDTIYLLTDIGAGNCGYDFTPYAVKNLVPDHYFSYLIYADQWQEYSSIKRNKRGRPIALPEKSISRNTFFTNRCKMTRHANTEEEKKLLEIAGLQNSLP